MHLEESPACEEWLYDAISDASQKFIDDSEIIEDQIFESNELEEKFTTLLEKMKNHESSRFQATESLYLQECTVCKEFAIFLRSGQELSQS